MKTTLKEYSTKIIQRQELKNTSEEALISMNWELQEESNVKLDDLKTDYFDKLTMVNVSFMIGSRVYYENVVKIGKAYFSNGRKMTQSNGYYCIEEIEEITNEMNESMISDSHYY